MHDTDADKTTLPSSNLKNLLNQNKHAGSRCMLRVEFDDAIITVLDSVHFILLVIMEENYSEF